MSLRISHLRPLDLDIALESPEGDVSVIWSDACGTADLTNANYQINQDAAVPLPDAGPCPDGSTFRPVNTAADTWPPPAQSVSDADLDRLNGGDPNGTWKLYAVDDQDPDSGTIGSWSVRVTTTRSEIVIPNTGTIGTADPYPSTKTFEAPPGHVIEDVNLVVNDFNHTHPDDVDMLLQGPGGATTMLMSDACANEDIHDRVWEFDDEAPAALSFGNGLGCAAGAVRPSPLGEEEILAPPGLAPPYGTQLSAYDGLVGGEWSLLIEDDAAADTGFLGGWSAQLTTRPAAPTSFTDGFEQAGEGSTVSLTVSRTGPAIVGPARLDVGLVPGSAAADDVGAVPSALEFARGEASKTIEVPILDDKAAEPMTETLEVVLSSPQNDASLIGVTVATVAIAPSDRNDFAPGGSEGRKNGSVELSVEIPGPGELLATGKKLEPASATASASGVVELVLKPSKKTMKKLRKGKRVKAALDVVYTPTGGTSATKTADVVFRMKRRV